MVNNKSNNIIKCQFCDWQTLNFYRTKKGKIKSGYSLLQTHVIMDHPNKYADTQNKILTEEHLRREREFPT